MKKCAHEGCDKNHDFKIFNECNEHLQESLHATAKEIWSEAFPEMNIGKPYIGAINPYAKFLRQAADPFEEKNNES